MLDASKENMSKNVPPGGSSTINGILYQMLWSLLRASRARFVAKPEIQDDKIQGVTLILEPLGGGGDLVVRKSGHKVVEQIKARSDGSTWSLREILEKVIPDLYLAASDEADETEYRFVTEGRMGDWEDVYAFFQSLRERPCLEDDPLSDLDDSQPLNFRRGKSNTKTSFWDQKEYTERSIFEKAVSLVRKGRIIHDGEAETTTQKNLRTVLGCFEFDDSRDMESVQEEIDSHLLAVVDRKEDLPQIRDSMLMELARCATEGDAVVDCQTFYAEHNLNAIPLTSWAELRNASHQVANSIFRNYGYEPDIDVRRESAKHLVEGWGKLKPVLAITGDSGSGKSWTAYAICSLGQCKDSLSVLVTERGGTKEILEQAASIVWQEIAGHDASKPLVQVDRHIQEVLGDEPRPWLTLIIDGSFEAEEALELIMKPWEDWGVRVVLTVSPRGASTLETESYDRCTVERVDDFSTSELHQYLGTCLGEKWSEMPNFVRDPLRKPIMASLYRQILQSMEEPNWIPRSEYELFSMFWRRLQKEPLGELPVSRLGQAFLNGVSYPFSNRDVASLNINSDELLRLERIGWLKTINSPTGNTFEFPHNRLLNWACAHAFLDKLRSPEIDLASISVELSELLNGTSQRFGFTLSFVPMDLLWLMCQEESFREQVPDILACWSGKLRDEKVLYELLLPTLGETAIPPMANRLRDAVAQGKGSLFIPGAIARVGGVEAIKTGFSFLEDEDPLLQREAFPIFEANPTGEALDRLWKKHIECKASPATFMRENDTLSPHFLQQRSFAALRECCRMAPDWLNEAIRKVDPETEAVTDLAYLLANVGGEKGRQLWQSNKATLFGKAPAEKQRCLANCIDAYTDRDEIPWLIDTIGEERDFLAGKAFACLARLAPEEAIRHLDKVPTRILYMTRSWFTDFLYTHAPDAFRESLRKRMTTSDMWTIAMVYDERTHFMDEQTLDFLLDDLEKCLEELLEEPDWGNGTPLFQNLQLLAQINSTHLVEHLQKRREAVLETKLTQFIQQLGPRIGRGSDSLSRKETVELLYRINGEGFTSAVNMFLHADSRYGRLDGLELAGKRPNAETILLLTAITEQEERWDGFPLEQNRAAEILAELDEWTPVIAHIRRVGLKTSRDLNNFVRYGKRPSIEILDQVVEVIHSDPGSAVAGDVLALGFGDEHCEEIVHSVLQACEPAGDVAHACIIALELLQDQDENNVPFLAEQLRIEKHNFSATNALIVNGTQTALEALADFTGNNITGVIGFNLVTLLSDPSGAIEKAQNAFVHSIDHNRWNSASQFHTMISLIEDEILKGQILNNPAIEEYFRDVAFADEGAFWFTGSKANAIRCLAYFDKNAAFRAAKGALNNVEAHDRDYYPGILAELNPNSSVEMLFKILKREEAEPVRKSIARTFSCLDAEAVILDRLNSPEADERRNACYAAGWAMDSEQMKTHLTECLQDINESVARAAAGALTQLSIQEETIRLEKAVIDASSQAERWLYLDCLLALADPGDYHHPWPINGKEIGESLTLLQQKSAEDRLRKRKYKESK
jgi:hypothetical protein